MQINWKHIRTLNGSQTEGFEEFASQLARREAMPQAAKFTRKGKPDAGIECYWTLPSGDEIVWQAKYFLSQESLDWSQVDGSIKTALDKHPRLIRYYVCIPVDLPDARLPKQKSAFEKWQDHVTKWKGWAANKGMTVEFEWWGGHEMLEKLSSPTNAGLARFWFDAAVLDPDWFDKRLQEAIVTAGPRYTKEINVELPIVEDFDAFGRTAEWVNRLKRFASQISKVHRLASYDRDKLGEQRKPVEDALGLVATVISMLREISVEPTSPVSFKPILDQIATAESAIQSVLAQLSESERLEDEKPREGADRSYRENHFRSTRYKLHDVQRDLSEAAETLRYTETLAESVLLLLNGTAGMGKTLTLETIRKGAEAKGYKVEGFAPTSRAAAQLREAGIEASTLQSFLARKVEDTPGQRHLYMLDESSLASSKQMRDFLQKVSPDDRVLVIGDVRQHQGVEAGKPFEQMQQAGMQTSQLDQIMRQKDAELLKAVQHLAAGETEKGVGLLAQQGRVTEVKNGADRIAAIAKDYAAQPENTLVVSPDNRSRQQINEAIRAELQSAGQLSPESREFQTLAHRSDLTGAGRTWAALYNPGDVIRYESGSNALGFERNSQARVIGVDARTNTLTVQKQDGEQISYDPKRLYGVNVFEERSREFSVGERIQLTAGNRDLGIANRDLGTITALEERSITIRMDGKSGREVTFDPTEFRQLDHGYAVTSHSSQGLTAGRVIAHIDTDSSRSLINDRLAYVAISRAAYDARIYTNDAATLGERLATDVSKSAALDLSDVRQAVDSFRRDDPQSATALLRDINRIHVYSDPEHRAAAVAHDYVSKEDRAVIFAPDKTEREELTRLIRADLHEQGRLGETFSANVLTDKLLSDKDAKIAANYEVGDVIRYGSKGNDELGISPNTYGTVTAVEAEKNLIIVIGADDSPRVYNPATEWQMRLKATVYSPEERELAVRERIQLTRSEWDQGIRVGNLATIEQIHEDGGLSVKVDSGASLRLTPEQAQHVEYGYAIESTKRLAVDRVILSGEAEQITAQRDALSELPAKLHDLTVYTSDGYQATSPEIAVLKEFVVPAVAEISKLEIEVPSIELEGYAIEM